jgi:Laminin EGF domain
MKLQSYHIVDYYAFASLRFSCVSNCFLLQPCLCNDVGSMSQQCNLTTGACSCYPGTFGKQCNKCLDGYTYVADIGCVPCNCSDTGATSAAICDKMIGQCQCKVFKCILSIRANALNIPKMLHVFRLLRPQMRWLSCSAS